jgi:hypothetical protein
MNSSFKLPAISARKAGDPPAGQQLLQAALASVVTAEAVEAIVRQIVEEAQTGTIAERRNARQLLFGLLGQKPPGAQSPSYVQNNHYYGPRTKGRCRVCGRPVKPGTGSGGICQACIDGPRPGDPTPEEIAAGKAKWRKRNGHATAGADLS